MISYSQIQNILRLSAENDNQRDRALLRNVFYNQDNYSIQQILKDDLLHYMTGYDIGHLQLVSLDSFVKSFLSKIALVHKSPMIIRFNDKVKQSDQDKFQKLLNEVEIHRVLQDTELRMKLHNTLLVGVRYFSELDKLYLDNSFDASNTDIIGFDGMETEEKLVIRYRLNRYEKEEYIVWDRLNQYNYKIAESPHYDVETETLLNDKYNIDGTPFKGLQSYYPFVKYQAADQNAGFWQYGMDVLTETVRILNILYTITAEDAIGESIRILILNFVPNGIDGKPGEFKVGLRNPIVAQNLSGGEPASAQLVGADLYVEEIITFSEKIVDQLCSMHGIDNVLTSQIKADLSGIFLRLKNQAILQGWEKDITVMRNYDRQLLTKLIEVNNYHRPDFQINTTLVDNISLDYQLPGATTNEVDDFTLEKMRWDSGVSSPLLYVMRQNPEFTKEIALQYIQENLKTTNELFGISPLVSPEEENETTGAAAPENISGSVE